MSASGTSWAQLRQQARSLETQVGFQELDSGGLSDDLQTEVLFHTYSQFASTSKIPPKPTDEERKTEAQIEELLERVGTCP